MLFCTYQKLKPAVVAQNLEYQHSLLSCPVVFASLSAQNLEYQHFSVIFARWPLQASAPRTLSISTSLVSYTVAFTLCKFEASWGSQGLVGVGDYRLSGREDEDGTTLEIIRVHPLSFLETYALRPARALAMYRAPTRSEKGAMIHRRAVIVQLLCHMLCMQLSCTDVSSRCHLHFSCAPGRGMQRRCLNTGIRTRDLEYSLMHRGQFPLQELGSIGFTGRLDCCGLV